MKVARILGITMLVLLPVALCAQEKREEEKKPEQKQQTAKPAQQQAKPAQQEQHAQKPAAKPAQQQAKPAQQEQHAQKPAARPAQQTKPAQQAQHAQKQEAKPAQQQHAQKQEAKPAQRQQAANRAQPAGGHGRIPDDRFRASFGRAHTFHVNRADFAGSSRRFQYGGFWFNVLDPWPEGWLYTDNVYVDYMNGGYFLCDPVHPGVYISINIG